MPFISQIATSPLALRQRMSVLQSPLMSAVPTMVQLVGTFPKTDVETTCVPFMNQIATFPDLGVKLSTVILAGPTVLSAVGSCPPHDGARLRWRINVASTVALSDARKKSDDLTTATIPAGTTFPAMLREPCDVLMRATRQLFVDQLKSVPSIHMRCRMTTSFRATATLALRRPYHESRGDAMLRMYLSEAAGVLLTRVPKWSGLKARGANLTTAGP